MTISEDRIPEIVEKIGLVHCQYELVEQTDYYQLTLLTQCQLTLSCQRCLQAYDFDYRNTTCICLCDNDKTAEAIMHELEPVVLSSAVIPFETLVADELHLYLPLFHQDERTCRLAELSNYCK